MNVDVLILSSIYDFSTDLVVQDLEKNKIPYLRLNKEHFSDYRISLSPEEVEMTIIGLGGIFCIDRNVKSIWFRQPIFLRNTPGEVLAVDEQLKRSQWMGFLRSLTIFEDAKWMNWPEATYLAETKAYQLMLAASLEFNVPKTKIGNDVNELKLFRGNVIVKSLDTVLLRDGEDCLFTYSTIKQTKEFCEEEIFDIPLTVQEYIYPKVDIRVTVIGDEIFALKITSCGYGIEGDWRVLQRDKIEYTDINLPDVTRKQCLRLTKKMKLNFAAIDLIESNGKYFFIEINPTGEWGWLVTPEMLIVMQKCPT